MSRQSPCSRWATQPLSVDGGPSRLADFDKDEVAWTAPSQESALRTFEALRESLLRCDVYPARRLRAIVCTDDRKVRPNALVVQMVRAGGLTVEAAVRVLAVRDERDATTREAGFTYATVAGHPERGVATFRVRLDEPANRLSFAIESWSEPGRRWVRLARPLVRRIQARAKREAMERIEALAALAASSAQDASADEDVALDGETRG